MLTDAVVNRVRYHFFTLTDCASYEGLTFFRGSTSPLVLFQLLHINLETMHMHTVTVYCYSGDDLQRTGMLRGDGQRDNFHIKHGCRMSNHGVLCTGSYILDSNRLRKHADVSCHLRKQCLQRY